MEKHRDIATPVRTASIMKKHGLSVKKSLGQNFLTEPNILTHMLEVANITKDTNVIEIGPGIGALTKRLARVANHVVAFEIDERLLPVLADTLSEYNNITVLHQDILQADLQSVLPNYFNENAPLSVVANLPYYITTPIIMHLLSSPLKVTNFVMMMQKEVAQRMTAKPRTKAYGSLTIAIAYYMHAKIAFTVPKTVFYPQPNVDSAILHLVRRDEPLVEVTNESFFFGLVRAAFNQRRKTLWNNLLAYFGKTEEVKKWLESSLEFSGIQASARAEELTIEMFAKLANHLYETKTSK